MDSSLTHWIYLASILFVKGALSICAYPGDISGTTVVSETSQTTYESGELLLYQCAEKGAGHITMFCQSDNTWSAPSRACSDSHMWESGAMSGVIVAGINYSIAIFAIIYSKIKFSKPKDEDDIDTKADDTSKVKDDKKQSKQEPVTTVVVMDDQKSRDVRLEAAESKDFHDGDKGRSGATPVDV